MAKIFGLPSLTGLFGFSSKVVTTTICHRTAYFIFTTSQLLPTSKQDVLPFHQCNNVIYQFVCHCDSRCIGRMFSLYSKVLFLTVYLPKSVTNFFTSKSCYCFPCLCKVNSSFQHCFFTSLVLANIFWTTRNALFVTVTTDSYMRLFHLSSLEATL